MLPSKLRVAPEGERPPRVYSDAERKRRWALIIDAILNDPGPDRDEADARPASPPAPPKQTA